MEEQKKATVYVKDAAGKLEPRRVTIGLNNGTYVELLSSDLAAGDLGGGGDGRFVHRCINAE